MVLARNINSGALEPISNFQIKVIESLLKETNTDRMKFLTWAQAKDVKDIVNRDLPSVMKMLEKKKEEVENKKKETQVK
jgi:DNA-binding transcriptional MerR regulator